MFSTYDSYFTLFSSFVEQNILNINRVVHEVMPNIDDLLSNFHLKQRAFFSIYNSDLPGGG